MYIMNFHIKSGRLNVEKKKKQLKPISLDKGHRRSKPNTNGLCTKNIMICYELVVVDPMPTEIGLKWTGLLSYPHPV